MGGGVFRGLQIGVFNCCEEGCRGIQIGLINSKEGYRTLPFVAIRY